MASALEGWGVLDTFRKLVELTYDALDPRCALSTNHGLDKKTFVEKLTAPQGQPE
jgi:hypothetical protein